MTTFDEVIRDFENGVVKHTNDIDGGAYTLSGYGPDKLRASLASILDLIIDLKEENDRLRIQLNETSER